MSTRGGREKPGMVVLSKWEEGVDERERARVRAEMVHYREKERERKRNREKA